MPSDGDDLVSVAPVLGQHSSFLVVACEGVDLGLRLLEASFVAEVLAVPVEVSPEFGGFDHEVVEVFGYPGGEFGVLEDAEDAVAYNGFDEGYAVFVSEDVADEALGFAFSGEVDYECFDLVWLVDDPVGGSLGDGSCGAGSSSHVRHFADH